VWEAMLAEQKKNLANTDMRAFRFSDVTKDFWTEQYMLAGVYL
jgi:hypothetical protein